VGDVRAVWAESSQVALSVAADARVTSLWLAPSSLPRMTVGDLVGHLLHSGVIILEESLDQPVPSGRPISTASAFALMSMDPDDEDSGDVRDVAAREGSGGSVELIERATASRDRLIVRLQHEPSDRVVALSWSTHPLPWGLDEFVAARILELVVHLDDLACSVEGLDVEMPPEAVSLVCHLGIDIALRRHGGAAVMRALYRRDRNPTDALRPF
jgi:hypothetical protein